MPSKKLTIIFIVIGVIVLISIAILLFIFLREKPKVQSLKTYRTEQIGGTVANGNTADLEGQVYYTGNLVANRHADWEDRVMTEYNIKFIPTNNCPSTDNYRDQYYCPPFGVYAKCNPGGCANKTLCETNIDCPGVGGVCTNGICVCCSEGADCKKNLDCGTGQCQEDGTCSCLGIDLDYACNVAIYPPYTTSQGDLGGVGAVVAPVDDSVIEAAGDSWVAGGVWYSFPGEAECSKDQKLGDNGCAWKQVGKPKSVKLSELGEKGFKFYCKDGKYCFSKKEVAQNQLENLQVLQKVFPDGVKPIENAPSGIGGPQEALRSAPRRFTFADAGISANELRL
jgi:hypothetical protein